MFLKGFFGGVATWPGSIITYSNKYIIEFIRILLHVYKQILFSYVSYVSYVSYIILFLFILIIVFILVLFLLYSKRHFSLILKTSRG